MNILVDSGLKKKIQIENRKHRRGIYYLWLFEKISFALVIAYAILFPIYCIDNQQFPIKISLRKNRLNGFRYKRRRIIRRSNNGDQTEIIHNYFPIHS